MYSRGLHRGLAAEPRQAHRLYQHSKAATPPTSAAGWRLVARYQLRAARWLPLRGTSARWSDVTAAVSYGLDWS